MTIADLIAAWDTGQPVPMPRIEGMGPSADQAVYILALEMLRTPAAGAVNSADREARAIKRAGPVSVAQVARARFLFRQVLRAGGSVAEGDFVLVQRAFPEAPPPPPRPEAPRRIPESAGRIDITLPGPLGTNFPRRARRKKCPQPQEAPNVAA